MLPPALFTIDDEGVQMFVRSAWANSLGEFDAADFSRPISCAASVTLNS
jgi:hypothetical protein